MKRGSIETIVGIFVVIGLICVGYMTFKLGNLNILGGNYSMLKARFSAVTGLKPGASVEMLGIQIGQVTGFTMDQEEQVVIVEMKIKGDIEIYDDALAAIKTSGLIGDKYIKIDAGGSGDLLTPGATIVDTAAPLDIEELISKYAFGGVE